jgi:membrane-associated phospholipid phosphatase
MINKTFFLPYFLIFCQIVFSQNTDYNSNQLELSQYNFNEKNFWDKESVQIAFVPTLFFGASAITWHSRENVREIRNRYTPSFKNHYDDYLQYAPAAATFGLKLSGVKGRNDLKRSAISYATSIAIMAALVNGIKYTAKVERPDHSTRNSFPSGHTSMAFTNATFLHKEYGLVNPSYSIAAYGASTMTGIGRSLNNRHWVSDVLAGAGIGILSTQLAYFFIDRIYGNKGDNLSILPSYTASEKPSFLSAKIGYAFSNQNLIKEEDFNPTIQRGWEAGLEGAYFFNKSWGLGGQFSITSFSINRQSVLDEAEEDESLKELDPNFITESLGTMNFLIGPYYSLDLSKNWNLMFKGLIGYSIGAKGNIDVRFNSAILQEMDPDFNIEEDEITIKLASYKPLNTFKLTGGMSLTYNINEQIGISLYSDFHHSKPIMAYSFDEDLFDGVDAEEVKSRHQLNYFSIGLNLKAYF